MATVITTSTTTAGDNIVLADGEDLFVAAGVVRASNTGLGLSALFAYHTIDIQGSLYGDLAGARLGANTSANTFSALRIGTTGSLTGHTVGLDIKGSNVSVVNDGYIAGNDGLHHTGDSFSFVNDGTVIGSFDTGVAIDSSFGHIVNYGTIEGRATGIFLNTFGAGGDAPTLDNYGKITAQYTAVEFADGSGDTVHNFGEVRGDVYLGYADDTLLNEGLIVGEVRLYTGADRLDSRLGEIIGKIGGGTGDDTILTGGEDNIIDGGQGLDTMAGGQGDDTYTVDAAGDTIIEAAGAGSDAVNSSAASYVLAANVETLILLGVTAINGTGNTLANTIIGNVAANTLQGGLGNDLVNGDAGADRLLGGAGNDTLTGGANGDVFVFNTALNKSTNRDVITDFSHVADTIQLENAIFKTLGSAGALNAAFFHKGAAAHDANDHIIYNQANGSLYYDDDGTGAHAQILFATLSSKPADVAFNDFVVI